VGGTVRVEAPLLQESPRRITGWGLALGGDRENRDAFGQVIIDGYWSLVLCGELGGE
jgi:hypothetical protein